MNCCSFPDENKSNDDGWPEKVKKPSEQERHTEREKTACVSPFDGANSPQLVLRRTYGTKKSPK